MTSEKISKTPKLKRALIRIIRAITVTFGVLIILALGAVTLFLWKPSLVINIKTFDWVLKKAKVESLGITLEPSKKIEVQSISFFVKKFSFNLNNICFKPSDIPDLHICADKFALVIQADFTSYPFRITRVERFELSKGTFEKLPEIQNGKFNGTIADRELGIEKTTQNSFGKWAIALHSQALVKISNQTLKLKADFTGKYPEKKIKSLIDVSLINASRLSNGLVAKLSSHHCAIELEPLPEKLLSKKYSGAIHLDCPILANFILPSDKKYPQLKLPRSTGVRLKGDFKTTFPFSMKDPLEGKLEFVLNPILHPLFQGRGQVDAEISGIPEEFPEKMNLKTALNLNFLIPKFSRNVQLLKKTSLAIPAPFNDLDGTLEAIVSGNIDLQNGKIPITLTSRLHSANQKFNVDGKGFLELKKESEWEDYQTNLTFDVVLAEVVLALPRLKLAEPPRLLPDSRIQKKTNQAQSLPPKDRPFSIQKELRVSSSPPSQESSLHYTIKIRTPENTPILVLSNLAKTPVPIHLALLINDMEPPDVVLNISRFPLELFRRKAELEHFTFKIEKAEQQQEQDIEETHPIAGVLKVYYTDYTIKVEFFGTSERPKIKLTSDPPLPENQAYAVLLFGRTLDALDASQGESVSNTQAAMTDGAIGLASFYVLASTPIESLAYDSETGAVIAKVRLGEGTSLNIGGSTEQKFIGIRRRLSRMWTLETDLTNISNSSDAPNTGVSAFLRWSNRY